MKHLIILLCLLCCVPAFAAPKEATRSAQISPETRWQQMTPDDRRVIIDAWMLLDETTRPPFPVFRDAEIEKQCAHKAENLKKIVK